MELINSSSLPPFVLLSHPLHAYCTALRQYFEVSEAMLEALGRNGPDGRAGLYIRLDLIVCDHVKGPLYRDRPLVYRQEG